MAHTLADSVDRDWLLEELLPDNERERLRQVLSQAFPAGFRLCGANGAPLLEHGDPTPRWRRAELGSELEPLGYLQADAADDPLTTAAALLDLLLRAARRYHTAADLHLAAVQADYEALEAKHAALQASESRYRDLAGELEQRVQQQVRTIEQRQRQLYQTEKLAAVGQLAAGVAHEINNPIGFVRSNLATAARYVEQLQALERSGGAAAESGADDDRNELLGDFADLVRESRDGVQRVAAIVADLRDFSRVDRSTDEVADVNQLLQGVCNMARPQIGPQIDLVQEFGVLPPLACQPGHLSQAFYNLILNAAQAMDHRGRIVVATAVEPDAIRVAVADNGRGMEPDVLARIFEPFFTTREVGQGVGLGLTVCNDVVQALGGRIEVDSAPGRGSTFTLHLPTVRD